MTDNENHRLDKIEEKLDKLDDRVRSMELSLAKQAGSRSVIYALVGFGSAILTSLTPYFLHLIGAIK